MIFSSDAESRISNYPKHAFKIAIAEGVTGGTSSNGSKDVPATSSGGLASAGSEDLPATSSGGLTSASRKRKCRKKTHCGFQLNAQRGKTPSCQNGAKK